MSTLSLKTTTNTNTNTNASTGTSPSTITGTTPMPTPIIMAKSSSSPSDALRELVDKGAPPKVHADYHILERDGELYAATLNQTDLITNSNKFHVMQLFKNNKKDSYAFFSRGGRVGYVGQWNCELYMELEPALADWDARFHEKTGCSWSNKDNVVPQPGRYDYIAMKYEDELRTKEELDGSKTLERVVPKLVPQKKIIDKEVEALMGLIWDPEVFKNAMEQVRIDAKRMPLGKISKRQLDKAYEILDKLSEVVSTIGEGDEEPDKEKELSILRLSSAFYTIIPYACGMSAPPPIRNEDSVSEKVEQLKVLDELIVAQEKLKSGKLLDLEEKYLTLNCGLKTCQEPGVPQMIQQYMNNTSGSTHNFRLNLLKVFEVDRQGESSRYDPFLKMKNRQLLWHGSRLANFVGILSQGLRINPSNVVKTGSMFGNGVYFANACTKSAQYMACSRGHKGLIMLCEVALGDTYELLGSKYVTKLPAGKNSTHGVGNHTPDKTGYKTLADGTIVPMGKLIARPNFSGSLRYDEFIVYNADQIRIKYLLLVEVN